MLLKEVTGEIQAEIHAALDNDNSFNKTMFKDIRYVSVCPGHHLDSMQPWGIGYKCH